MRRSELGLPEGAQTPDENSANLNSEAIAPGSAGVVYDTQVEVESMEQNSIDEDVEGQTKPRRRSRWWGVVSAICGVFQ